MAQEAGNDESKYYDDRNEKMYGLQNGNKIQFNTSMVWVPLVIGASVACGVLTTRGLQRLFTRAPAVTRTNVASSASSSASSSFESTSRYTAKTFTGYVPYGGDFKEPMDIQEAALILGCRETSSKDLISKRFKTLMKNNHPDQGGSAYLASKLNDAKTVLIKGNHH
eukprot:1065686_1